MSKRVFIVIGCDTDPDRASMLNGTSDQDLSWRGMLEGIPIMREKLSRFRDSTGKAPVYSWCLRADNQMERMYGAANYILERHKDFFIDLEAEGDELSWHPHFWRLDEDKGVWYQEYRDADWQVNMLNKSYKAYQDSLPYRAESVRMGWVYHNNHTYAALDDLGIKVDFSGIPGLKIIPSSNESRLANFYDWSLSPNRPYYPSRENYQREPRNGELPFKLLQAPNFVSKSIFWGTVSGLQFARKMRNLRVLWHALRKPTYWISITAKPALFRPLVAQIERTLKTDDSIFFVNYFHPDELLPNRSNIYSLQNLEDNVRALLDMCEKLGATTEFITAKQIVSQYTKTENQNR